MQGGTEHDSTGKIGSLRRYFGIMRTGTIWLLFTGNIPQEIVGNGADSDMRRYFLERIK